MTHQYTCGEASAEPLINVLDDNTLRGEDDRATNLSSRGIYQRRNDSVLNDNFNRSILTVKLPNGIFIAAAIHRLKYILTRDDLEMATRSPSI